MRRNQPCAHMRPDYNRLEDAYYITRNPVTDEISWPPTRLLDELRKLGLVEYPDYDADGAPVAPEARRSR